MNKMTHKIIITLTIVATILILLITAVAGLTKVYHNYEIERCNELQDSNYKFDVTVETNAQYAKECYDIQNNPFYYPGQVIVHSLLLLVSLAFVFVIFTGIILR